MSDTPLDLVDRLLIDKATQGLSPDEEIELEHALQAQPWRDAEEYDRLTALLDLALWNPAEVALPAGLSERIHADALGFLQARAAPADEHTRARGVPPRPGASRSSTPSTPARPCPG